MAVLVREGVKQTLSGGENFRRELDGRVVAVCCRVCGLGRRVGDEDWFCRGIARKSWPRANCFTLPTRATRGGGQLFRPEDLDATRCSGQSGDLGTCDLLVEFREEGRG